MMKFNPWSDTKDNLWKPSDNRTSDETTILWDGPDGPDVITDLFGNRVKIINTKQKNMEPANILVQTKLTQSEYDKVKQIADSLGISVFKYVRDCIRKQIDEHEYLMEP